MSESARRDPDSGPRDVAHPAPGGRLDLVANAATIGIAVAWLARLVPQALAARLQTDECFHAWVARWIGAHAALPARIDGLYGGFGYFYPPLFHLLGGLAFRADGLHGFLLVNVAVVAALLVVMAFGARGLGGTGAARWAVCLCVASGFLAEHAVRLYVEALSTLLVVAAVLVLAQVLRVPRGRGAVTLGALAGLAIDAKLSALVLPPAFLLGALAYALRGRRDVAGALLTATGVALAVAAPLFARNVLLFGSPIYPALGRDVNPLIMALNVHHFTPAAGALYADTIRRAGPATLAFLAAGLALSAWRRRAGVEAALVAIAIGFVLAAPLQALVEVRHLLPLMIACAALAAVMLARALEGRVRARRVVDLAALAFAAWALITMPRWRRVEDLDQAPEMDEAFVAIRAHVPAGETLLARETYDTFWYANRPANWPVPFGQHDPPIEMFLTPDPDSVAAALRAHGLRWLLLTDDPQPGPFDGADWPVSLTSAIDSLADRGRAREVWSNDYARLVRVGE